MAESNSQEKTEEPSEKKLRESKEKGQVARSKELNIFSLLLFSGVVLKILGPNLSESIIGIAKKCFTLNKAMIFDDYQILVFIEFTGKVVIAAMLPIFLVMIIVTIISSLSVGGWVFSAEHFSLKFNRINPINGLKKIFSSKMIVELLKSILKFSILSLFFYILMNIYFPRILKLNEIDTINSIVYANEIIVISIIILSLSLIIIVFIDVPYQIFEHVKQLKMTKQELKEEHKDTEGSPELKSRIRSMQRKMAKERMMHELPKADVVITNPTHFAVALKYDNTSMKSPKVVAKGLDKISELIKSTAASYNIPIVSIPPLARTLYYNVEIDQEIPNELFLAVAKVLAYIYELRMYQQGKAKYPTVPTVTEIPKSMLR